MCIRSLQRGSWVCSSACSGCYKPAQRFLCYLGDTNDSDSSLEVSEALFGRSGNAMQDARILGRRPDSKGQFGASGAGEKPETKVDSKAGKTIHDLS